MLRTGITSEMGAGKTFISNVFATKGVKIYNCDNQSKWLILNNSELIEKIKKEFGEDIYEGESVFKNLSKQTFVVGGDSKLKLLMSLISPYFQEDLLSFYERNKEEKFCLVESAILFEHNMEKDLDRVIYVSVPEDIRIQRAISRDGITAEQYRIRMKDQIDPIIKIRKSDYVISNYGDFDIYALIDQVYNHLMYHDPSKYLSKEFLLKHLTNL